MCERKVFKFYKSYYDVFKEMDSKNKLQFIEALFERQFFGTEPTNLTGMAKFAYISQKFNIDSQVNGFEAKTGLELSTIKPPTQPPTQPPIEQIELEEELKKKIEEDRKKDIKPFDFQNISQVTWDKWKDYKKSQFNFSYKSKESEQIAINSLIKMANNDPVKADKIVDSSISNGYKGLFELKESPVKQEEKRHLKIF